MTSPRLSALAAAGLLALVVAGCGGGDTASTTAAPVATTTAATTTQAVATTAVTTTEASTTTAAPTGTTAPPTTSTAGPSEVTITANDNLYDINLITIEAGQELTVILNNRDTASEDGHNIRFEVGSDVYATEVEFAPFQDSVTFTVDTPGEYKFFCETHTIDMVGTLVVTSSSG